MIMDNECETGESLGGSISLRLKSRKKIRQEVVVLVYHFVGTAAAGEGFGLGFKGKPHTEYITHRFF